MKAGYRSIRRGLNHSEVTRPLLFDRNSRHGGAGTLFDVVFDHLPDVHAVDMIGSENHDQVRICLFNQVDVLIDGVRRAPVPVLVMGAHLRRDGNDEVVLEQTTHFPALTQVLQQ